MRLKQATIRQLATSSLGSSSTSLTELLRNPALTLGASLSLPFLQYNDMKKISRLAT